LCAYRCPGSFVNRHFLEGQESQQAYADTIALNLYTQRKQEGRELPC
jgi:hypothetical protein